MPHHFNESEELVVLENEPHKLALTKRLQVPDLGAVNQSVLEDASLLLALKRWISTHLSHDASCQVSEVFLLSRQGDSTISGLLMLLIRPDSVALNPEDLLTDWKDLVSNNCDQRFDSGLQNCQASASWHASYPFSCGEADVFVSEIMHQMTTAFFMLQYPCGNALHSQDICPQKDWQQTAGPKLVFHLEICQIPKDLVNEKQLLRRRSEMSLHLSTNTPAKASADIENCNASLPKPVEAEHDHMMPEQLDQLDGPLSRHFQTIEAFEDTGGDVLGKQDVDMKAAKSCKNASLATEMAMNSSQLDNFREKKCHLPLTASQCTGTHSQSNAVYNDEKILSQDMKGRTILSTENLRADFSGLEHRSVAIVEVSNVLTEFEFLDSSVAQNRMNADLLDGGAKTKSDSFEGIFDHEISWNLKATCNAEQPDEPDVEGIVCVAGYDSNLVGSPPEMMLISSRTNKFFSDEEIDLIDLREQTHEFESNLSVHQGQIEREAVATCDTEPTETPKKNVISASKCHLDEGDDPGFTDGSDAGCKEEKDIALGSDEADDVTLEKDGCRPEPSMGKVAPVGINHNQSEQLRVDDTKRSSSSCDHLSYKTKPLNETEEQNMAVKSYHSGKKGDPDVVSLKNAIFYNEDGCFVSCLWTTDELWEVVKKLMSGYETVQCRPSIVSVRKNDVVNITLLEPENQRIYGIDDGTIRQILVEDILESGYFDEYFLMTPSPKKLVGEQARFHYKLQVNENKAIRIPIRMRRESESTFEKQLEELNQKVGRLQHGGVHIVYHEDKSKVGHTLMDGNSRYDSISDNCSYNSSSTPSPKGVG